MDEKIIMKKWKEKKLYLLISFFFNVIFNISYWGENVKINCALYS